MDKLSSKTLFLCVMKKLKQNFICFIFADVQILEMKFHIEKVADLLLILSQPYFTYSLSALSLIVKWLEC